MWAGSSTNTCQIRACQVMQPTVDSLAFVQVSARGKALPAPVRPEYGQSPYYDSGFQRV